MHFLKYIHLSYFRLEILFYVPPIFKGSVLVFVLVCITLCPFSICNHLDEEDRVGCFALLSFLCLITVNFLWFFLTVSWAGLQFVIVVFPDHTHLHFSNLIYTTDEVFSENREDRKSCFCDHVKKTTQEINSANYCTGQQIEALVSHVIRGSDSCTDTPSELDMFS